MALRSIFVAVATLAAGFLQCQPIAAERSQATVTVSIAVQSYAELTFPNGSDFILTVRPQFCPQAPRALRVLLNHLRLALCSHLFGAHLMPPVVPARVPFAVDGNADVQVSVQPDEFLRIHTSRYLGQARQSDGATLGYHVVMHFPAPSRGYHWVAKWLGWDEWQRWNGWQGFGDLPIWSRIAHLPRLIDTGTAPLAASLPTLGNHANGVVYAVARNTWTANGTPARPGDYHGSVFITVTAQ